MNTNEHIQLLTDLNDILRSIYGASVLGGGEVWDNSPRGKRVAKAIQALHQVQAHTALDEPGEAAGPKLYMRHNKDGSVRPESMQEKSENNKTMKTTTHNLKLIKHPAGEDGETVYEYADSNISVKFKATKQAFTYKILKGDVKLANKIIDKYIQGSINNKGMAPEAILITIKAQ